MLDTTKLTFCEAILPKVVAFSLAVSAILDAPSESKLQPEDNDETVESMNSCDWLFGTGSREYPKPAYLPP